ncbi:MAG: TetR family transcriptional regulator C-terminal domain-containing protein, partial [Oscillospiraceae bacterium]|nr:TetR family transcriptional regulator C-terminal domain-containing protein [Oscillospiraceae bacterium]
AVLLSSNGDISFQKKLRDIIDTKTLEIVNTYLAGKASKDETVLITSFIINGILGIISTWLQNISIGTPEKMAATACSLIENGINGFYTKN